MTITPEVFQRGPRRRKKLKASSRRRRKGLRKRV